MRNLLVTTATAAILAAGAANAASVSYTASVDGTAISGLATATPGNVQLPGFIPGAPGIPLDAILTNVSLSFFGIFNGELVATLTGGATAGNISGTNGFISSIVSSIGADNGVTFPFTPFSGGTAFSATLPGDYNYNIAGQDFVEPFDAYGQPFNGAVGYGPFNPANVFYDGVPTVTFTFLATANDLTTADAGVFRSILGYGLNLDAAVTYTFTTPPPETVIPVPAALPLLATGLGLFGLMRLRRKSA